MPLCELHLFLSPSWRYGETCCHKGTLQGDHVYENSEYSDRNFIDKSDNIFPGASITEIGLRGFYFHLYNGAWIYGTSRLIYT